VREISKILSGFYKPAQGAVVQVLPDLLGIRGSGVFEARVFLGRGFVRVQDTPVQSVLQTGIRSGAGEKKNTRLCGATLFTERGSGLRKFHPCPL